MIYKYNKLVFIITSHNTSKDNKQICTEYGQMLNFLDTLELVSPVGISVYHNYYTNRLTSTRSSGDHDLFKDFHFTLGNALNSANLVHNVTLTRTLATKFIHSDYIRSSIKTAYVI